ncbi:MAG: efflux RND transporter periplasmic adaptor subunit [Syntrophales bacterium]|nr:efflux RND transporter periplasmic adaptor subunit [Syntrophales bacterium]
MKKKQKIGIAVIAVLMVILVVAGFLFLRQGENSPKFRTEKVTRGNILAAVTATGTINAVVTVLVGTQVSGTIKKLYVDFNSPVKKGQILALIDPATFMAQVEQARANLLQAKAGVEKSDAALADTRRIYERYKILFARELIARSDLDTAEANYQSALAQLSVSKGQVTQMKAALDFAEINLKYTRIVSPVDGTVISRSVDVGQTVAASFQTPTLFNIAQDLKRMQIDTNVDEADIGKIKVDQPVTFTVDAYPERTFKGKVSVVRNAPITVQNVVTYDVVINVDNSDLNLKPGMTANVSIIHADREDVMRVPNAALRFKISERGKGAADQQKGFGVWVMEDGIPKRIRVKTGINDGHYTECLSGDLKENQDVVVEALGAAKKNGGPAPRSGGGPGFMR